jgi:hypothetical protein
VGLLYQIRCACGAEGAVETASFDRPLRCRACSGSFKIVWTVDPQTHRKIPRSVSDSGPAPRVFEIPAGAQEVACACGQHFLAWPRQVGKRVQCAVCGKWSKLQLYKDPETLSSRIRIIESRLNRLPSAPPKQGSPKPDLQSILCTCGESLQVGAGNSGERIQCPACGTLMRLDKDPDTETSIIAIYPQTAENAEPSPKRGIDEDLSLDDFR